MHSEEDVKFKYLVPLLNGLGYKTNACDFNVPVKVQEGRKETTIFADAVVYDSPKRKVALLLCETKSPQEVLNKAAREQAISYARLLPQMPPLTILCNGLQTQVYSTVTKQRLPAIPPKSELVGDLVRFTLSDDQVRHLRDEAKHSLFIIDDVGTFKNLLEACHNAIRNNDGLDPTAAFDEMSKLLFCKLFEERRGAGENRFTLTAYDRAQRDLNINLVQAVFEETKADKRYGGLFPVGTTIALKPQTIRRIVELFQDFDLALTAFDVKGEAFEYFLGDTFTGGLGEFFTPRNVVEFMVGAVEPRIGHRIVDPFCGTGGFLLYSLDVVNQKIRLSDFSDEQRATLVYDLSNKSLFGTDWKERTSQACKMNMTMHGDGSAGIVMHDGLTDVPGLIEEASFDLCLTNPPFGSTETDPAVLARYELGAGRKGQERLILGIERCLRLVKPGGVVATVIIDGILNNASLRYVRDYVRREADLGSDQDVSDAARGPVRLSVGRSRCEAMREARCCTGRHVSMPWEPNSMPSCHPVGTDTCEHQDVVRKDAPAQLAPTRAPSSLGGRRWMRRTRAHNEKAVVSLAPDTFMGYGAGAKTSILIMTRRNTPRTDGERQTEPVFMAIAANTGYAPSGAAVPGNELPDILIDYREWARTGSLNEPHSLSWLSIIEDRLDAEHYISRTAALKSSSEVMASAEKAISFLGTSASLLEQVQSAISSLGADAIQWSEYRMGDLLEEVSDPVNIERESLYRTLGVRKLAYGAFIREPRIGKEIKAKKLFRTRSGLLIYNRLFAHTGSFAVLGDEHEDCFVSGEFPMFAFRKDAPVDPDPAIRAAILRLIVFTLVSDPYLHRIDRDCTGSTKASRSRFNQSLFRALPISLPTIQAKAVELVAAFSAANEAYFEQQRATETLKDIRRDVTFLIPSPVAQRTAAEDSLDEMGRFMQLGTALFAVPKDAIPTREQPPKPKASPKKPKPASGS